MTLKGNEGLGGGTVDKFKTIKHKVQSLILSIKCVRVTLVFSTSLS